MDKVSPHPNITPKIYLYNLVESIKAENKSAVIKIKRAIRYAQYIRTDIPRHHEIF